MNDEPCPPPKVEVPFELPKTLAVEMSLYADVTLTQELCDGIADQYPDLWEEGKNDPEALARATLYALINPRIPSRAYREDYWDGVVETLEGLVENVELDDV